MALRTIGKRSASLNAAAIKVARRLAAPPNPPLAGWERMPLRELASPAVTRRLAKES